MERFGTDPLAKVERVINDSLEEEMTQVNAAMQRL